MLEILYTPAFLSQVGKLEDDLSDEVREKIALLKDARNHRALKVHKLKGLLKGRYSFSVNYKVRVVFRYSSKNKVVLLVVGDHDVYK